MEEKGCGVSARKNSSATKAEMRDFEHTKKWRRASRAPSRWGKGGKNPKTAMPKDNV